MECQGTPNRPGEYKSLARRWLSLKLVFHPIINLNRAVLGLVIYALRRQQTCILVSFSLSFPPSCALHFQLLRYPFNRPTLSPLRLGRLIFPQTPLYWPPAMSRKIILSSAITITRTYSHAISMETSSLVWSGPRPRRIMLPKLAKQA
jgi:hypothetical protein